MIYLDLTTVLHHPCRMPERVQAREILRGKYRVERVLGAGGMGTVVLAVHLRLLSIVAIKVLKPEARDREAVVTLLRPRGSRCIETAG